MRRSRILLANCYDYPQYYDVALPAYTKREADFIEAACRKYCPFDARRFLEPACGAGRLITELAARGYEVAGFDLSRPALSYLRRRLARVDAAYCTVNTFRHLLTEQAARGNLVYRPQPSSGRHLYPRLASAAIACQESTPGAGRSGEERQK